MTTDRVCRTCGSPTKLVGFVVGSNKERRECQVCMEQEISSSCPRCAKGDALAEAVEEILANGYDQGRRIVLRARLAAYRGKA